MAIIHDLGYQKTVETRPALTADIQTLTVVYYHEDPVNRVLKVLFQEIPLEIVIWEGAAYDAVAADWTDADVLERLQEMYPNS